MSSLNDIVVITTDLIKEASSCDDINSIKILKFNNISQKIRKIDSLSSLRSLTKLDISYHTISIIEGLESLSSLVSLNLSENSIRKIENISSLRRLETLNLAGNYIQRIPDSMSSLRSLTDFNIARNEIDNVKDLINLSNIGSLNKLNIHNNPISKVSNTLLYTIYTIPSLHYINDNEITMKQRTLAIDMYAKSEANTLVNNIKNEMIKVQELGRKKDATLKERDDAIKRINATSTNNENADPTISKHAKIELDELNQLFEQYSDDFTVAKKSVVHLQRRLQEIKDIDPNAIIIANDAKTIIRSTNPLMNNTSNNNNTKSGGSSNIRTGSPIRSPTRSSIRSPVKSSNNNSSNGIVGGALGELVIQLQRDLEITRKDLHSVKAENDNMKKDNRYQSSSSSSSSLIDNLYHDLEYEKKRNEDLQFLLNAREEETSRLRIELDSVRSKLMSHDQYDYHHQDNRNNELIIEVSRHKNDITNLTHRCELLQNDLDNAIKQATLSNEKALHAYQEADTLRGRLAEAEATIRQHSMTTKDNEKYQKRYEQLEQSLLVERQARAKAEREKGELQETLNQFDADMKAYLRASQQHNDRNKHKKKAKRKSDRRDGDTTTYLDGESTASDDDDDDIVDKLPFKSVKSGINGQSAAMASPGRLGLAAAETLAQLLLDEIQSNKGITKGNVDDNDLKEACVRSALRLVQTAVSKSRDEKISKKKSKRTKSNHNDDDDDQGYVSPIFDDDNDGNDLEDILPLEALGDRNVLARIVAEARAGMCSIEEIQALKKEQEALICINNDLDDKGQALERMIVDKEEMLEKLVEQTNESKKQAQGTIDELDNLSKRLIAGKDEISRTEADHILAKRLLDACRQDLQDAIANNDIEHKNLASVRERVNDVRKEIALQEEKLLKAKEKIVEEESKIRQTKAIANDQLRILQTDLGKIEADFKNKQRAIEDMDKYRRAMEEESEVRRRDLETQLAALIRDIEEENRKLSNARSDARAIRLESEQLIIKKRQAESDYLRIAEKLANEKTTFETEEIEYKRKIDSYEKILNEHDRKARSLKERVNTLDAENTLLRQSVEELRRHQGDLERAMESRRRSVEEELSHAQAQTQIAVRATRQAISQGEQKRAEIESMLSELRATERRLDESKRGVRENEGILDAQKEVAKSLDAETEKLKKESSLIKKEEEESKHQLLLVRNTIENETRVAEDIRRRLVSLTEEEESLKESEGRLKSSLALLRKNLDDSQIELDDARASSERERRALSDMRAKKAMIDADITRCEEEHKFVLERINEENKRRVDAETSVQKIRDEITRAQYDLHKLQRTISETSRREDEMNTRESELRALQERQRTETDTLIAASLEEKQKIERLRSEQRQVYLEIKQEKEDLRRLQHEQATALAALETTKLQHATLEGMKDELSSEIEKLRDIERLEHQRTERLESGYKDAETRLRDLRNELSRTEENLERVKSLNSEEERRVNDQRKQLRSTMEELASIERAVVDANRTLFDERNKAIMEMGQLSQAKQSAQSQMLMVAEAQRRLAMKTSKDGSGPLSLIASDEINTTTSSHYHSKYDHDASIARKIVQDTKADSFRTQGSNDNNNNDNGSTSGNDFKGIIGLSGRVSARSPFASSVPLVLSSLNVNGNPNDSSTFAPAAGKSSDIDKLHVEVSKLRAKSTSILSSIPSSAPSTDNNEDNNNNDRRSKAMQSFFSKSNITLN